MKTKTFLLIATLLLTQMAGAQIMFERTYGGLNYDWGTGVQQTSDSGYIATGASYSYGDGTCDVYLLKTDKYGNTLWYKTFGGIGYDIGISVKQTMDGGYIVSGSTLSFGHGSSDVFVIRTNDIGDTLWTKTYGGSEDESGNSIIENNDGTFVIAGNTWSFAIGLSAAYILKIDEFGNLIWQKSFEKLGISGAGDIIRNFNSGYFVSGYAGDAQIAESMFYLIKIKENGDSIWTKTYSSPLGDIHGASVKITQDYNIIVSGYIKYLNGEADLCLMKTDTNGNFIWLKKYGGVGVQQGGRFCETNDGGLLLTGMTGDVGKDGNNSDIITFPFRGDDSPKIINGNLYLLKINYNGDSLLSRVYGNSDNTFGNSVQNTNDNGYIICGGKTINSNQELYLVKTDNSGLTGVGNYYSNKKEFKIYPNPNNGIFQIQYSNNFNEILDINTYSFSGELISNCPLNLRNNQCIDLSIHPNGIYLIQIKGDDIFFSTKIIIQK